MQFLTFFTLALSAATSVNAAGSRNRAIVSLMKKRDLVETQDAFTFENGTLSRRECVPSSCDCQGFKAGIFCGDDNLGCKKGNVFQCNTNGHLTCDFGIRKTCQKCDDLKCA
ncbi:hypothetical protein BKA62DRAFT_90796 [Auriculariales sp. MPI-PUGE-AT-0066]|nr:hypothetical protein BKA62DRAFT_90796 [Auriculariales sp. MPI-PUGE-AT-0066]